MFRHFARSTRIRPATALSRPRWTGRLLLGGSASALALYATTKTKIYADVVEVTAPTKQSTPWFADAPPSTDHLLSWNSMTEVPPEETGITRIDSVIIQSNSPSEDFISVALADQATVCGIFDGHNGTATSAAISLSLPTAVLQALDHLFLSTVTDTAHEHAELGSAPAPTRPSDAAIDTAIKDAFLAVDRSIVAEALHAALAHKLNADTIRTLAPAQAGSCALLGIFEHETRQLRVALTGDSRAVLGRRVNDTGGQAAYEVHVLSRDQNGHNPAEVARIGAAHPGEAVADKGRVMGWGMSRAFGDASTKWSLGDQERVRTECLGDRPYANVKTPPYFTAEPEITTTQVRRGDFLIMASDGLWECLTSEEAVGLVGVWLRENKVARDGRRPAVHNPHRPVRPNAEPVERDALPVELKGDDTIRYRYWRAVKRFLNVDDNASVHLARNALGGANRDLTGALLALTPPRARRFRDDISVSVIFFD